MLAHPNLKVFVTHGGLLSTQEALYHNVPLVGTPLGMDQMANMRRAEKNGFGIVLDFKTLTKERLVSSIKKAFTDKNMHESMAKMHKLFTDYRLDLCCIFFCLHFIFPMPDFKSLGPTDF